MDWKLVKAADFIDFNPRESVHKGTMAKKVAMEQLQPFTRDIPAYEVASFNGGSKFRNGDTLMARITPCLENGKTAQVNILEDGEVGFGSTEFIVLRAKPGVSDKDFIYYLAMSPILRDRAIKSMVGSSGRQRVQQGVINDTEFLAPPMEEQIEIGSTLRALDDKIANNTKINNHLEQIARAIFKSWFVDFEPWGGAVPDRWRDGTISDLGDVIGGSTPSKAKPEYYTEHGIAWITPKDLSIDKSKFIAHGANDITELGLRNSSARLMPRGTVLFSSRAPIGYIAVASGEVCTNQGFKSIVPKESVGTAFIYYFLIENLQTIENMASGSTFKEVSGSTMKGVAAIIPDDETLRSFQEECTPIFEKQELLEAENAHLADIRDSLLPRLMSGELSVADINAK
jgi:type I restriction enzyme S subunit